MLNRKKHHQREFTDDFRSKVGEDNEFEVRSANLNKFKLFKQLAGGTQQHFYGASRQQELREERPGEKEGYKRTNERSSEAQYGWRRGTDIIPADTLQDIAAERPRTGLPNAGARQTLEDNQDLRVTPGSELWMNLGGKLQHEVMGERSSSEGS